MSYQLIERPHKFCFSANPVRYVFNVSNPDTPGCAMEVALYIVAINGDPVNTAGTLVTKQTLTPNPDGSVYFYCEDYLNSQLDWELPTLANNNVIAVTKQIKYFYIEYRQITKANTSPEWASDQLKYRMVLKGGVAKEKFDRNNFFINYLPTKKPFLTWLPDKHLIGLDERRYLSYFHTVDPNIAAAPKLKARVVYTDGVQETVSIDFPSLNSSKLFHCPAGLQQLGLYDLHPDKQIWYYDVSVEDDDLGVLANPYRMYADYNQYYNVFSFVYHNSISGIDTLRIRGDYDIEIALNTTDIQQATGGDFSGEILPTENASINISSYKTFDGDAGFMNTKQMQEALEELLLSDGVYRELFGKRWLRVVSLNKSQKMGAKDDTKWSFPIKWRYTFDNTQFTPFDTDLGAGVMDEPAGPLLGTCTAPSGLAIELIDDEPAVKTYRASWDAVLDAQGYEIEVTDPNGVVTTTPLVDTHYDIVAATEGDWNWRVRTKCGDSDYSGFSQGTGFHMTIAPTCDAPANVTVVLLGINDPDADVKFSWAAVAGIFGYWLEWREVGASIWNSHLFDIGTTQFETTLKKDVQYEYRVRSQCNDSGIAEFSGYTYGVPFVPSNMVGGCAQPSGLGILLGPISSSFPYRNCTFFWTAEAGDGTFCVKYRVIGSSAWTTVDNINQNSYPVVLQNGLPYEWQLYSNCAAGGISPTINGANFHT